jgi:two-component system OmpR family sensor kinase
MTDRGGGLSFRQRLTLRWTIAFGLLLGAVLAAVYVGSRILGYRTLEAQVRTLAATELASAVDESQGVHIHDLPVGALNDGDFAGKLVQVYDSNGALLMESADIRGRGLRLDQRLLEAGARGEGPLTTVSVGGRPARLVILRTTGGPTTYLFAVGLFADRLEANLRQLAGLLAAVWTIGLVLTGGLGYVLASLALGSINRITEQARVITRGNFAARLDEPEGNDEIGRMARLLNEMLDRLHGSLEANRRFAANASHELRSPLTAMTGEIDVTLKRLRSGEEYRETLRVLRQRLDELGVLADNLILLVRAQERAVDGLVQEVELGPLFEAAARHLEPAVRSHRITLAFDRFPDLIAYGHARLLARVVDNLLANAVQYNREGGQIVITGRVEDALPGAWETSHVVFHVSDSGQGIPREDWSRVFERFYSVDPSRSRRTGGSGLGLALCHAIVTLFQGEIRVATSSDAGTTFEVRLPGRSGSGPMRTGVMGAPAEAALS